MPTDGSSVGTFDSTLLEDSATSGLLEVQSGDAKLACPGGPGCPCSENANCDNALCLDTSKGKFCAENCVDSCPDTQSCSLVTTSTGDNMTVCIDRYARLCDPCSTDNDCQVQGFSTGQSVCIDLGAAGRFCGTPCAADSECPTGYGCADVTSAAGKPAKQCLRKPEVSGGAPAQCECSVAAKAKKLSTNCASVAKDSSGKVIGQCPGTRSCGVAGLTVCQAPAAAKEACDGLDNDCNGITDDAACNDNNQCTTDICDPAKGCSHQPGDLPCDADNNACTVGDLCQNGVCLAGKAKECNDQNPCSVDKCVATTGCVQTSDDGAPCNDENPCTLGDVCANSSCSGGKPKVCNSTDPCVEAKCNLMDGGCKFTAKSEGAACDDGQVCTAGEACVSGNCSGGKPLGCDDGNACTIDSCGVTGACVNQPAGSASPCNDGNPCNTGATCSAGVCGNGKPKSCADSNPCTTDSCDVSNGSCKNVAIAGCTGTCPTGVCPDNGNSCTQEKCVNGQCLQSNAAAGPCNVSGNPCHLGSCANGVCAPSGPPKTCDDANPCTDDTCGATGACDHLPNAAGCNDNNLCTAPDTCGGGVCKAGGAACNLGDACTGPNQCKQGVCLNGKCQKPAVSCGLVGKAAVGTLGDISLTAASIIDTDAGTIVTGATAVVAAGSPGVFEVQQPDPGVGGPIPHVMVFDCKSFKVLPGVVVKVQGKRALGVIAAEGVEIAGTLNLSGSNGGSGSPNAAGGKGLAGGGGFDGGGFVSGPGCLPTNGMGHGPQAGPAGICGGSGGKGGDGGAGAGGGGGGGGCGGGGGGGGGRAANGQPGTAATAATSGSVGAAYGGAAGGAAGSSCGSTAGEGQPGAAFGDSVLLSGGSGGASGGYGGLAGFGGAGLDTKNGKAFGGAPGSIGGIGGGGGGGGALMLCAGTAIAVTGSLEASGGLGGVGSGPNISEAGKKPFITLTIPAGGGGGGGRSGAGGGGGGGGGGTIQLIATSVILQGNVLVKAGLGGAAGSNFGSGGAGGGGSNGGASGGGGGGGGLGGKGGAGGQGFVRIESGSVQGAGFVQGQLVQVP